jgi:hypothetical protein
MNMESLGLDVQKLIAGFAGSVVHAFFSKQRNLWILVGTAICGALIANYCAPLIEETAVGKAIGTGMICFAIGFGARDMANKLTKFVNSQISMPQDPSKKEREQ